MRAWQTQSEALWTPQGKFAPLFSLGLPSPSPQATFFPADLTSPLSCFPLKSDQSPYRRAVDAAL